MPLYDQHLHSRYSCDSEADPEGNVLAALDAGLAGLTFTEHFDTHPSEWPLCRYDYDAIRATLVELREKYGRRLFIGHGIEICYQPERMEFILDYLGAHKFDLVLLSVHWFRGGALHKREHWNRWDVASGTRAYLETVLEAVRLAGSLRKDGRRTFDVLGHLDLVKRYTQRYFQTFDIHPHADLVDAILRAALDADLVPEINMSSLRQAVGEPMPADWVVRRYAEIGGTQMSIGSDSHQCEHIGYGLPEAAAILKANGIRSLAVFQKRERLTVPLP